MNITFVDNAGAGTTWTEQGRVGSPLPPGSASWRRGMGGRINGIDFICPCGCQDLLSIPVSDGQPERPVHPLRDLTDEEKARHAGNNYVKFEAYPDDGSAVIGRFWTQAQLNGQEREQAWAWNGDLEKPTLSPSIQKLNGCRWHGWLQDGVFRSC